MGIEPMTPVLPRLCATSAPHGLVDFRYTLWVGSEGFEPPKSKTADLQSAPFGHFGNCPGRDFQSFNRDAPIIADPIWHVKHSIPVIRPLER